MNRLPAKKVLVIGGTGETGRRILRALRARHPELQLTCAARRPDHRQALPAGVEQMTLDLNDHYGVLEKLRPFDLVIIALGPMDAFGSRPHQLCLEAGVDCVDINDSLEAADKIQALQRQARMQNRRVLTGMGLTPGLSGLLLMKLAREHASPSGTYRSRFYAGAAYGGGESSPYVLLDSFKPQLTRLIDGERRQQAAQWDDAHSQFRFPGQAKAVPLIAYSAPEIAALGRPHDVTADSSKITTLDYRYHIQFLTQRSARMLGRLSRWKGMRKRLAGMFYKSGQSMKERKNADPDCSLWVYPDDRPADGWVVHGCISSYDFTALTACAAAYALLDSASPIGAGVHSMEQLPETAHRTVEAELRRYGITARPARELDDRKDPLQFGWCQVVTGAAHELTHYGQCWYDAKAHPRMSAVQTTYLTDSAIWARLRERNKGPALALFVGSFVWRWRQHYVRLASYREQRAEQAVAWKTITRDISMFTSGYSRARDLFGQEQAFNLYRQMFLATGCMEMRWLWPAPDILAVTDAPANSALLYWQAFMSRYKALGLLEGELLPNGYRIDRCTFAEMFTLLGCPELNELMREMEHEALQYMTRQAGLRIDWQATGNGCATIALHTLQTTDTSLPGKVASI